MSTEIGLAVAAHVWLATMVCLGTASLQLLLLRALRHSNKPNEEITKRGNPLDTSQMRFDPEVSTRPWRGIDSALAGYRRTRVSRLRARNVAIGERSSRGEHVGGGRESRQQKAEALQVAGYLQRFW